MFRINLFILVFINTSHNVGDTFHNYFSNLPVNRKDLISTYLLKVNIGYTRTM